MRSLLSPLWDVLYPARWVACGRTGAWICASCLSTCRRHGAGACPRCGERLWGAGCETCGTRLRHLDSIRAVYEYSGPVRLMVLRLKYGGLSAMADWMAARMSELPAPTGSALVPVPMYPRRQKERGFNQVELLASALGRREFAVPQERLDAEARWHNVQGALEPAEGPQVAGAVVLVDDVCTTGATLEECARVLVGMGAERVSALVFARA